MQIAITTVILEVPMQIDVIFRGVHIIMKGTKVQTLSVHTIHS